MEYMNILCVVYNDGTADKKSMYTCDTQELAEAGAHKYMGSYMGQSNVASVMTMAISSHGNIYSEYHWIAPEKTEDAAE